MRIFPVYVVIDFSESMAWPIGPNDTKIRIDVARDIIPTLTESMEDDASIAESLRVRVIGFNRNISFCTELLDYYGLIEWYNKEKNEFKSKCMGTTWYGNAFAKLHSCINDDIDKLTQNGDEYLRPLVYFLTDGKPEGEQAEERNRKYEALVNNEDPGRNPVILCVGIGREDMSILEQYGASRVGGTASGEYRTHNKDMTFVTKTGVKTGEGLKKLNEKVIRVIKDSLRNRVGNDPARKELDCSVFQEKDVQDELVTYFSRDRALN